MKLDTVWVTVGVSIVILTHAKTRILKFIPDYGFLVSLCFTELIQFGSICLSIHRIFGLNSVQ